MKVYIVGYNFTNGVLAVFSSKQSAIEYSRGNYDLEITECDLDAC